MIVKKVLFLCLITALFTPIVHAQGIASRQEAVNYFKEGVKAQKSGDFAKAQKEYAMTEILNTKYHKYILHNTGVMYAQRGMLKEAVEAFKEVLRFDPNYMPAKLNMGLIYDMQADKCKSLEYWNQIFNIDNAKPKNFVIDEGPKVVKEEQGADNAE
jgi:tetratricopeptide (TPR) repeat protein